ncbi:MAG TPA: phospholipid carrier-dependent glycosyltransferase [Streptosporangiaceae bacterium]
MIPATIRRHWMLATLILLGAALRVVTLLAYHPALIFPDSVRYLQYAHNFAHGHWTLDGERQSGYSILIIPPVALNALWLIPLVQHLAGLATALVTYVVLIRLGARRWLAALATVPVLFDPLQLIGEQYVLTDVWTALLLLAALAILVWRQDSLTAKAAAAAGLLLGLAVTFRDQELIMIVPAAGYVLATVRPSRRKLRTLMALIGAFAVPVAGYLGWFDASHGQWNFSTFTGAFLYGRVADFADCGGLAMPAYEKPLCPTQPARDRVADFYTWNPASPQWTFTPPRGKSRDSVVEDFSLRILRHQPLAYAEAAARDFLYGFSPARGSGPEHYPLSGYLRFQQHIKPDTQADASLAAIGIKPPRSRPGIAAFLQDYGQDFYIPGPLFAAALLLGLAGCLPLRNRAPGNRSACVLFTASAIVVLIPPALFATFDWRYQLPQLSFIPIAAVLATPAVRSAAYPDRETPRTPSAIRTHLP